jgi:hypothetical protein
MNISDKKNDNLDTNIEKKLSNLDEIFLAFLTFLIFGFLSVVFYIYLEFPESIPDQFMPNF